MARNLNLFSFHRMSMGISMTAPDTWTLPVKIPTSAGACVLKNHCRCISDMYCLIVACENDLSTPHGWRGLPDGLAGGMAVSMYTVISVTSGIAEQGEGESACHRPT